ncbi:carbohydrate sulfotransferase 1-like [Penaeus vannamei]|uniref:carbohydrate sulfotransferase 1-like n=1 Tax=Penaeus vannamei TaxID=6689 RepID=UPI00387F4EEC
MDSFLPLESMIRKISSPWTLLSLLALLSALVTLSALRGASLGRWEKVAVLRGPFFQDDDLNDEDDDYYTGRSEDSANAGGEDDDYWEAIEEKEEEEKEEGKVEERRGEKESGDEGTTKGEEEEKEGEKTTKDEPKETEKQKVILLWTSWRSGSTFLGELLKRVSRKTFYSYEPLHLFRVRVFDKRDDGDSLTPPVVLLRDLLQCNFEAHANLVKYQRNKEWYARANTYLGAACKKGKSLGQGAGCSSPRVVSEVCRSASVHLIKVLRLSLRWARTLLENKDLDFQILYLVRDPRAVLSSRGRVGWCKSPSCKDPNVTCSLLAGDLAEVPVLQREFPDRFKFLLYDELCQDMTASLADIMAFLGLPVQEKQTEFLQAEKASKDKYSVNKNSLLQAQLWRSRTSYQEIVQPVQRSCKSSLEKLGLRTFPTEEEFLDLNVPAIERPSKL